MFIAEAKTANQKWMRSTRWQSILIRTTAVVLLVTALVVGTLLIVPQKGAGSETPSIRQDLVLVSGPAPVLFDDGKTWKWLDLPNGKTVVTFSPGGGPKNDGLRGLGGQMRTVAGPCKSEPRVSYVESSFEADGHHVGNKPNDPSVLVELRDHVDEITLTINVSHFEPEGCSLSLEWRNPSIERSKPLPAPAPSPS